MQATASMIQGVPERNLRHPLRINDAIEYMASAQAKIESGSCQLDPLPTWAEDDNYDWVCPEEDCPKKKKS
jgi:hypothetical protein